MKEQGYRATEAAQLLFPYSFISRVRRTPPHPSTLAKSEIDTMIADKSAVAPLTALPAGLSSAESVMDRAAGEGNVEVSNIHTF